MATVVIPSILVLAWVLVFIGIIHACFILVEEPGRERRFGDAYRRYRNRVPRWIPRG